LNSVNISPISLSLNNTHIPRGAADNVRTLGGVISKSFAVYWQM